MQVNPPVFFSGIGVAFLFFILIPLLLFRNRSKRDALARQAAYADTEANTTSALQRREGQRSDTMFTLPTYERDVNVEEEKSKFEAEIKRLEAEQDSPSNRELLAQLKGEVVRLNRVSTASSQLESRTLYESVPPITVPPPTYVQLEVIRSDRPS